VTRGSAGIKLSGSANMSGVRKFKVRKKVKITNTPKTSLTV